MSDPTPPRRVRSAVAASAAAALLVACGGTGAASPDDAPVRVRLVSAEEPRPVLPFSPGSFVWHVARDSVLLVDEDDARAVLWATSGAEVEAWGRAGPGPAELTLPVAAFRRRSGDVIVLDARQQKLAEYAPDGSLVRTSRVEGWPVAAWLEDDSVFGILAPFAPGSPIAGFLGHGPAPGIAIFEKAPELAEAEPGEIPSIFVSAAPCGPGAFVVGNGRRYQLTKLATAGSRDGTIGRPEMPTVYRSAREMASLRERIERFQSTTGARMPNQDFDTPRPKPFFGALAEEGSRVWVATALGGDDSTVVDVFRCDGPLLGSARLRDRVVAMSVRAGQLVALVRRTQAAYLDQMGLDVYEIDDLD